MAPPGHMFGVHITLIEGLRLAVRDRGGGCVCWEVCMYMGVSVGRCVHGCVCWEVCTWVCLLGGVYTSASVGRCVHGCVCWEVCTWVCLLGGVYMSVSVGRCVHGCVCWEVCTWVCLLGGVYMVVSIDCLIPTQPGTSDPYVKFKLGEQKYKSRTVMKDLNPKWNESFILWTSNIQEQLKIKVYDYDRGWTDDYMGGVNIDLTMYPLNK